MASSKDLSTPHCSAEARAWLHIYLNRIGWGKPLIEAFSNQFPECDKHHVLVHAANVRDCDREVQSQLLDHAKQYSWYEKRPKKGEKGYKRMKRIERYQEARKRKKTKDASGMEELKGWIAAVSSKGQEDL